MGYKDKKKTTEAYNRWKEANPEKARESMRRSALRRSGWTPEKYEEVRKEQRSKCAICGKLVEDRNMDADHIHVYPPVPRGLLCSVCNKMIGLAKDSILILESAIEYLKKYEGKTSELIPKLKKVSWNKGRITPDSVRSKISRTKRGLNG